MALFQRPQFGSALSDVTKAIRTPVPHKIGIAGVCAALTYALVSIVVQSFSPVPVYPKPVIVYVKQWPKSRGLAQIRAEQKQDAPLEAAAHAKALADQKAQQAAQDAADTKRRAEFERVHQVLMRYGIN